VYIICLSLAVGQEDWWGFINERGISVLDIVQNKTDGQCKVIGSYSASRY